MKQKKKIKSLQQCSISPSFLFFSSDNLSNAHLVILLFLAICALRNLETYSAE